jgi:hypothetical protein
MLSVSHSKLNLWMCLELELEGTSKCHTMLCGGLVKINTLQKLVEMLTPVARPKV